MKKQIILIFLLTLLASRTTHPMLQQQPQQAQVAQGLQPVHEVPRLAQQAAQQLLKRPWYIFPAPAHGIMKSNTVDHWTKGAIAVETKSPEYAYNLLLKTSHSPYTAKLLQIVISDIIQQIKSNPPYILAHRNLGNTVLPKVTEKDVNPQHKEHLHNTLAFMLSQVPEFAQAKLLYFPQIILQPGELNLEQIILLLLINPSQNQRAFIALSQNDAHNILTQSAFKTLPDDLKQILRNQLSAAQVHHLTRRNAVILTTLLDIVTFKSTIKYYLDPANPDLKLDGQKTLWKSIFIGKALIRFNCISNDPEPWRTLFVRNAFRAMRLDKSRSGEEFARILALLLADIASTYICEKAAELEAEYRQ